jgi:hypothetical protein
LYNRIIINDLLKITNMESKVSKFAERRRKNDKVEKGLGKVAG